ncbi:hypothetical protein ACWOFR_05805 [Carnobacterium gallinarum]|uniref:hypothetical protein n=1 Tax=Carnobacterium gallinarum TaxID=2749 RepID=UPI0005528ADE|nr:hypothetical protein [Carnobacterium gallinarum]
MTATIKGYINDLDKKGNDFLSAEIKTRFLEFATEHEVPVIIENVHLETLSNPVTFRYNLNVEIEAGNESSFIKNFTDTFQQEEARRISCSQ